MTSTVFTSGTVVASTWLNDVNAATYTTVPGLTSSVATKAALGTNNDITSLNALTSVPSVVATSILNQAGNLKGAVAYNSTSTQSSSDFGKLIEVSGLFTLTLPSFTGIVGGATLTYWNYGSANVTLVSPGPNFQGSGITVGTTFVLPPGLSATFIYDGTSLNFINGGAWSVSETNNTAATSDLSLNVGASAYISYSSSTAVPLHIATGDNQLYELTIQAQGATGSTGATVLNPNNSTYTNYFVSNGLTMVGGGASSWSYYCSGFILNTSNDTRLCRALVSTKTSSKNVLTQAEGYTGAATYFITGATTWQAAASSQGIPDYTTTWTSLGSITFPVASSGQIIIRRLA